MSVRESSTLHILTHHSHGVTFGQQGGIGQQFAHGPIEGAVINHFCALCKEVLYFFDGQVVFGDEGQFFAQGLYGFYINARFYWVLEILRFCVVKPFPGIFYIGSFGFEIAFGFFKFGLQLGTEIGFHLLGQSRIDIATLHEFLLVNLSRIDVFVDQLVHRWLGKTGLITLVVSVFAITQQIDENVLVELEAIGHGQFHGMYHSFYIIGIHVQHRAKGYFGHVGTIGRCSGIEVVCGETNLVVGNYVDGTAHIIGFQTAHLNHFVHDALTCNRSIAMDEDRTDFGDIALVFGVEFGANEAFHHGVYRF